MSLVLACTMWLIGGLIAMLIRLELFQPGLQFLGRTTDPGNRVARRRTLKPRDTITGC